eukprot:4227964-Prymnesium_polylepis.1
MRFGRGGRSPRGRGEGVRGQGRVHGALRGGEQHAPPSPNLRAPLRASRGSSAEERFNGPCCSPSLPSHGPSLPTAPPSSCVLSPSRSLPAPSDDLLRLLSAWAPQVNTLKERQAEAAGTVADLRETSATKAALLNKGREVTPLIATDCH